MEFSCNASPFTRAVNGGVLEAGATAECGGGFNRPFARPSESFMSLHSKTRDRWIAISGDELEELVSAQLMSSYEESI